MGKSLYLLSSGRLARKDNTIVIENDEGRRFVPVETADEIMIFGDVTLNKRFLEFATEYHLALHFFNHYGYYQGTYYPREHYNSGAVIIKQCEHYTNEELRLKIASRFVYGAIENMKKVVGYYGRRQDSSLEAIEDSLDLAKKDVTEATGITTLMGIEGKARNAYYKMFDRVVQDPAFSFEIRSRRPPQNRMNALISFLNSMCYVTALGQIYQTHLDPRIGYLHETNFRRFSLNLDIAEIFKPILVDRLIFTLLNKKMIEAKHFAKEGNAMYLTDTGRGIVLRTWEERLRETITHPRLNRKVSYRTLIKMEVYKLERHILGDAEYRPFISRW
ncbi:MAG: type I-B CRISPR-associated endonuclease Cas1b [Limnochordia bacterium]|nr:type I-B CRISPR-associated endonuclease Cas1b [Limnochordia bacterium]